MTFSKRRLEVRFELGQHDFGLRGANAVTLKSPVRMRADISYQGGVTMANAELTCYGVPLDIMAKLTVLNKLAPTDGRRNIVTIMAGDDDNGLSVAFTGVIGEAWADMKGSPEAKFVVSAFSNQDQAIRPIAPTSYRGKIDVAQVVDGIGAQWNPRLTLENSGVNAQIDSPYLSGTLMDQFKTIAKAADINCVIDGNVVAIWPRNGVRNGQAVVISPDTGMVGYPAFTQNGVQLSTLYNPSLTFGRRVKIDSILSNAAGVWRVDAIAHNLESEMPNGVWFTQIECGFLGFTPSVAPNV